MVASLYHVPQWSMQIHHAITHAYERRLIRGLGEDVGHHLLRIHLMGSEDQQEYGAFEQ